MRLACALAALALVAGCVDPDPLGNDQPAPATTTSTTVAPTTAGKPASREARTAVLDCLVIAESYQWGAADGIGAADILAACGPALRELEVDTTAAADEAQVALGAMLAAVRQSAVTPPDLAAMAALDERARTAVGL